MRDHRHSPRIRVTALLLGGLLCAAERAHAECGTTGVDPSNNLSLECLVNRTNGKAHPTAAEQASYRALVSELSGILALPMNEPADTVGFNGFHFSFDTSFTTINQDATYWSGKNAGVRNATGSVLPVLSLMMRKGVWLPLPPLPSVELGFGASNLVNSDLFAINGYLKLALHEGYHNVWVPSVAARASVTRLAGAAQLDLTIINADLLVSKAFGLGGTFTLEPYVGGGVFWSIARSQVIDTNPALDLYRGPVGSMTPFDETARKDALNDKIVFPTQDDIMRWRVFLGLHFHYSIVALTGGFTYIGQEVDTGVKLNFQNTETPYVDPNGGQYQINFSIGLRF